MTRTFLQRTILSLTALVLSLSCLAQDPPKIKWTPLEYQKIERLAEVYLSNDYPSEGVQDLFSVVMLAVKKFDSKKGTLMDKHDIIMLYGQNGDLGVVDYILKIRSSNIPRPGILEVSLKRAMNYSLYDVGTNLLLLQLVSDYINKISPSISDADLFVIFEDGLLEELADFLETNRSYDWQAAIMMRTMELIGSLKKMELSAERTRDLEAAQAIFLEQVEIFNTARSRDKIDYGTMKRSLCSYLDVPVTYATPIEELAPKAVSKILSKESDMVSDEELELLLGKGKFYYYLLNEAEALQWSSPNKYDYVARVLLVSEQIRTRLVLADEFPYKHIETMDAEFRLFNRFYSPDQYWKDILETYSRARKNKDLMKDNTTNVQNLQNVNNKDTDNAEYEQKLLEAKNTISMNDVKKNDLRNTLEVFVGITGLSDKKLLEEAFSVISANAELNSGLLSQLDLYNLIAAVDFGSMITRSSELEPYMVQTIKELKEVTTFKPELMQQKSMEKINRTLREYNETRRMLKK